MVAMREDPDLFRDPNFVTSPFSWMLRSITISARSFPVRRDRGRKVFLTAAEETTNDFWSRFTRVLSHFGVLDAQYRENIYYITNKSPAKLVTAQSSTKRITTPKADKTDS